MATVQADAMRMDEGAFRRFEANRRGLEQANRSRDELEEELSGQQEALERVIADLKQELNQSNAHWQAVYAQSDDTH
eukprot:3301227-Amphidinium_carterae.1